MPKVTTTKSKTAAKLKPQTKTKAKSASAKPTASIPTRPTLSGQDRLHMIQYAAYHLAEKDGFQPGKEMDYWLQAERQINNLFLDS